MTDKQHITINIADAAPLSLDIPREKEEMLRKVEVNVNNLYAHWRQAYKDTLSSREVLAMVAFRYAQVYYELQAKVNADEAALADAEKALDRILLDVK